MIKMFVVVLLYQFDIAHMDDSGEGIILPPDNPHSVGVMRSEKDLQIVLRRRQVL